MHTRTSHVFKLVMSTIFTILFFFVGITAQTTSTQYGVVASAHPLASKAGLEILKSGGNAVDAAVAAAFVLSVVEPYASGLGGGGFITIKNVGQDPIVIDYREAASACVNDETYYGEGVDYKLVSRLGGSAVAIPGVAAGLNKALKSYGSMKLAELLKPAINIANNGYEVSQTMADLILEDYGVISANEETANLYLNSGMPRQTGEVLQNKDLAVTLEYLGKEGLDKFYNGELSDKIVSGITDAGGCLSSDDLKNYKAIEKKPIIGSYKGYEIISTPPPSGGGTHLVELLNILENFDLQSMGLNSAEYINTFAQAILIVQSDKAHFMADPDFYDVPIEQLTDKTYAANAAKQICHDSIMEEWKSELLNSTESGSTTSLSVIDKDGNMVTITQSICLFFGSGVTVPGTGILLNNHMSDFDDEPGKLNSIEPGKRPVSSIAPTIILKDGQPFLTIGTPSGSRIIGTLAQIIVNIIDFNMSLQDAINEPRFHVTKEKLQIESRVAEDDLTKLKEIGYDIQTHPGLDKYFGGAQGVMYDSQNNTLTGAADPRRGGAVEGL